MTDVYLSLGSNERPLDNLRAALTRLGDACTIVAVSSVYRSTDSSGRGADYLNMAVHIMTDHEPAAFKLDVLRVIEHDLGRERGTPEARTRVPIDLDISMWGTMPLDYGDKPWHSPSAEIARHAHVAIPLAEIAPDLPHPETGEPLATIARRFGGAALDNLGPINTII